MIDFAINNLTGDLSIKSGKLSLVSGNSEILQRVKVRLGWFLGEWFLDTSAGVPWMESILGKKDTSLATLLIRRQIIDTLGVDGIKTLNVRYAPETRGLSVFAVLLIGGQEIPVTEGVQIV